MKKNLGVAGLIMALLIFFTSTAMAQEQANPAKFGFKVNIGFAVEAYYLMMDIPNEVLTVPANPADSSTGSTSTELPSSINYAVKLNLRAYFFGTEDIQLYGGVDFGISPVVTGYRQGIYATELSNYGGESYAYSQLIPSNYSIAPVLGLQYYLLVFEVSFPNTSFTLETGNDRWGSWEKVNSFEWQGFGQRYMLGFNVLDDFQLGLYYEHYQPDFDGQQSDFNIIGLRLAYYFL